MRMGNSAKSTFHTWDPHTRAARSLGQRSHWVNAPADRGLASILVRCAAVVLLIIVIPISAQSPGIPVFQPNDQGQSSQRRPLQPPVYNAPAPWEARRITALNVMRHKAMVSDTDKLLLLAKELNADAENMSPIERVHKAAEIEKLAKSVKEKMSYAVGDQQPQGSIFNSTLP